MKLVTAEEMQMIDNLATTEYKIPSLLLMENAGLQVARVVQDILPKTGSNCRILILAGKGNNGGDGLVAARHLLNAGLEVKVVLLARSREVQGDAGINLEILRQLGVAVLPLREEKDLNAVRVTLLSTDLIVDAIYGTGFRGKVPSLVGKLIRLVNSQARPVIAVDIPSGVEASTGMVASEAMRADYTVTFALPKVGTVLEPGHSLAGELKVVDISIPRALLEAQRLTRMVLDRQWCRSQMVKRPSESHKGDYGHVLVLGGSVGLTGAVCLTGEAALRTGAGLVTVGVPASLHMIMETKLTEVMSRPLPETANQTLAPEGLLSLEDLFSRVTVVAVGPGMSRYPEAREFIRELLKMVSVPIVIDADGLNALAEDPTILQGAQGSVILTPHPGEMARLLGISVEEVQADRLAVAHKAATQLKAVVVLKGAQSVVATPEGQLLINPTGNPGMATGGTGDVLTGIIAGLIAQGLAPATASALGVYIHGAAGDLARREKGMRGLIAGDLLQFLPVVLRDVEEDVQANPSTTVWKLYSTVK